MSAPRRRQTDALVVRLHAYGESSAVTVMMTANLGLVHAVAKGAKRVANGYRGPLDKAVLYRIRLGRRGGDGLFHLNSSTVLEPYARLRRDPPRFHVATLVLEVGGDLMRENEPHGRLFRLAVFTLKVLDRAPPDRLGLSAAFFLARAVALTGHEPEIGHCVACGGALGEEARTLISAARGGVLHQDCGQGEPGARSVSREALDLLRTLWANPASEVLAEKFPPGRLRELRRLLEEWLEHVLERRFRTVHPMEKALS